MIKFLTNLLILFSTSTNAFTIIAHKGFHNNHANLYNKCTTLNLVDMGAKASENTVNAVKEALIFGATMAEIDLRLTKDKKIVVFHDSSLECKTNGKGLIRDHDLSELLKLDANYNLSFNGGKTFPLRGTGVGKIQELSVYIERFPNQPFHFNPKDKTKEEVDSLIKYIKLMTKEARENSYFWGEKLQYDYLKSIFPEFGDFLTNGRQTRRCFNFLKLWHVLVDWNGLPQSCLQYRNITIDVNDNFPFPYEKFSEMFIKHNIQLWGYNVHKRVMLKKLKSIDWYGIITPRIGTILKYE